ncbi:MAG: hypothetical protein ACPG6J_05125, partial [Flavobacteriaceae bacterium]
MSEHGAFANSLKRHWMQSTLTSVRKKSSHVSAVFLNRNHRTTLAENCDAQYCVRMENTSHDRLLIIDFGSQVTQLIARRLRE